MKQTCTNMEFLRYQANFLGKHTDTEWAEKNAKQYYEFADLIEEEWAKGNITDKEFDELALTAFYDYDNLKCDYE